VLMTSTVFTILGCVKKPSNGVNDRFPIKSDWDYDALRIAVASRMNCYPGTMELLYRLSTDRQKDGPTDLSTEEKFTEFITRMRTMLAARRKSAKELTVHFEDGNAKDLSQTEEGASGKSGKKSKNDPSHVPNKNIAEAESKRQGYIEDLKVEYKCDLHSRQSKDGEIALHCYIPKKTNTHYILTDQDMRFWANDIVAPGSTSSVLNKPAGLILVDIRNRTRGMTPVPSGSGCCNGGGHGGRGGCNGGHGGCGGGGQYRNDVNVGGRAAVEEDSQLAPVEEEDVEFPSVSQWLIYLDSHPSRPKTHPGFDSFEDIADRFKENGFILLDQVSLDDTMTINDFCAALNIKIGLAASLVRYAKLDIRAIKAGQLRIP